MNKTRFFHKWKRLAICLAVATAMILASKADTAYAGDFTAAAELPVNGAWSGKCELKEGTTDYYKFTISQAGLMDIKLMSYTNGMKCTLYDSNYERIAYQHSHGSETSPKTEAITKGLSQGTYYVTVSQWSDKSGTYRLWASFSSSGIKAADGDSFDLPQNMRINSKVSGVMTYSNEIDWYKIQIPAAGKYRYIGQRSASMSVLDFFIYDANLTELDNLYIVNRDTRTGEIEMKPGTYYIKVKSRYYGTYTFQFKEDIPVKGVVLTDSGNQAKYKVTKAGKSGGTVAYQGPVNGVKASATVPSTVRIDNITYKVTGIAPNAFKGNSMLKKVTVGKNVTSIGANAFSQCTGLRNITIPAKVSRIGKRAFYGCRNLKKITIKSAKLTSATVGANAFKGIHKKAAIKVPGNKLRSYKGILRKKGAGKEASYKKIS